MATYLISVKANGVTKNLKFIIDVTIGYPEGKPLDLLSIIFGHRSPFVTTIHYRRFLVSDVPRDEKALLKWMYDRYVEKELLLKCFYETGKFPESTGCGDGGTEKFLKEPRALVINNARCLILNVIFILSSSLHVYISLQICSAVKAIFGG